MPTCNECGGKRSDKSRSGLCRKCSCAKPMPAAQRANIAAAVSNWWKAQPDDHPALVRIREQGKQLGTIYGNDPVRRAMQRETIRRKHWVPDGYEEYNRFLRVRHFSVAERKVMIAEKVRADEAKRQKALSPFERQMEKVRNGAKLVEEPAMPSRTYAMTLGGVSEI